MMKIDSSNMMENDSNMMENDSNMMSGPDQLISCSTLTTSHKDGAVKLRLDRAGRGSFAPISVPGLMMKTVRESPDLPALKTRDISTGTEKVWSWAQYLREVRTVAKAFIYIGLSRFDSVCILGFNSPEWAIGNLAAIFAGGLATGIYPTNSPEACRYIMEDSKCSILVVEDERQLDKVSNILSQLPYLKTIVQYSGVPSKKGVLSWTDLVETGEGLAEADLDNRLGRMAINNCCTLVYTSGTTGNPKGVMLSHDNMTWSIREGVDMQQVQYRNTRLLSYLPLSHIAGQMIDIYLPMTVAGTTYFADKDVLKTTLLDNLTWCRPTGFFGVPRVWEKIMEKMLEKAKSVTGMKKSVSTQAKLIGLQRHKEGKNKIAFKFFQKIYYSKVKQVLGLDQCISFYSGAAPLDRKTANYFLSLDIKICELYGMSESAGLCTMQTNDQFREGSVGKSFPAIKTRLVKPGNEEIDSQQELEMWGRMVMMGYLNREDAIKKDITMDGWLKTGDLCRIEDGFHFIVGREKDLIITAGGENIAPQPIHERIKDQLPIVSQVLLLGDKQKFVSAFLTLAVEINPDTFEPTSQLSRGAMYWCREVAGSEAQTVEEVIEGLDHNVMRAMQEGIDRVNRDAVSRAQRIQKWMILPKDFSIPGGEMTPTMKLKRNFVTKKYQHCIEKIYSVGSVTTV